VNVAIIGLGYWGPNLLRNFSSLQEWNVAYVVDSDEARVARALAGRSGTKGAADAKTVFDDPAIDAVAIATPPNTHYDLVTAALLAGKHVLVEKPLCLDDSDGEKLCELAERTGKVLMVDHTFLYTPSVEKIHELARSGALGQLYYIDSIRVNLGLFQAHANVVEDLAPHDISIFNYILGERPIAVSAVATNALSDHLADAAYISLRYPSGIIAHTHVSWISPVKVRKMMIAGSKSMVTWDDVEPSEKIRVYDRGVEVAFDDDSRSKMFVSYRSGDIAIPALDGGEALQKVARAFAASIRDGSPNRATGRDGLAIVQTLSAARRSMDSAGAFTEISSTQLELPTR
jgi:predicted dehydrogenase